MDALASCAFGVESGSFTDKNSEFVQRASALLECGDHIVIVNTIKAMFTPSQSSRNVLHNLGLRICLPCNESSRE